MNIIKRDGKEVLFNPVKIYNAISGANDDAKEQNPNKTFMSPSMIQAVTDQVVNIIQEECDDDTTCTVEDVQDFVETKLMENGYYEVAKRFIRYRQKHEQQRDAAEDLMKAYDDLLFADSKDMDLKRDNANVNTDAPMGIMLKLGAEGAKTFAKNFALPEKYAKPHIENYYHIHDMDFSFITLNCLQQDLGKTLKGGFNTGHGFLREPNSIRSAASLACISIQSSQNDCFGGQSISALDYAFAPYVDKSFRKAMVNNLKKVLYSSNLSDEIDKIDKQDLPSYKSCEDNKYKLKGTFKDFVTKYLQSDNPQLDASYAWEEAYKFAEADVEEETAQAMEAMIHNFNTLHSRAGKMCA